MVKPGVVLSSSVRASVRQVTTLCRFITASAALASSSASANVALADTVWASRLKSGEAAPRGSSSLPSRMSRALS